MIQIEDTRRRVLQYLEEGEVFELGGDVYIKTDNDELNALCVTTGRLVKLDVYTPVVAIMEATLCLE